MTFSVEIVIDFFYQFLNFFLHVFPQRTAITVTALSMVNSSSCGAIEKKTMSVNHLCCVLRQQRGIGEVNSKAKIRDRNK